MSVNFLFELTNDILSERMLKNKAGFQKKTYCIHPGNNRKAIHPQLLICNLEPCSSKRNLEIPNRNVVDKLFLSTLLAGNLWFTCRYLYKPPSTHISSFNDAAQE